MALSPKLLGRFQQLFSEFVSTYFQTSEGQEHQALYAPMRAEAKASFQAICAAADSGADVTQDVLLKLLPYTNTAPNRDKGAWIHIAPAITTDVVKWFEGAGWTKPEDWPRIARAVLKLVRRSVSDPAELESACEEFDSLPYSRGFQSGMLSPVLNALRPEVFLLINNKSSKTIGYFAGEPTSTALKEYPQTNAVGWRLIEQLTPLIHDQAQSDALVADLLDAFAHWLVAIEKFDFGTESYWKVATGEEGKYWSHFRDGGYVAIGWDDLGDITSLSHAEFAARRDELVKTHDDWKVQGTEQVWTFAHIQEGDRVVANRGTKEVLGIGTVAGPYYCVPEGTYRHRLPVEWDDLTVREVNEPGWIKTLIKLDRQRFEKILQSPPAATSGKSEPQLFTPRAFELLATLQENPRLTVYEAHKQEFKDHVQEPFQRLFALLALRLPPEARDLLETQERLFSRIPKNDYGRGGAWDFYWGAFYPKASKRTEGAQLFVWINADRLRCGFYIGHYAGEERARFVRRCRENAETLLSELKGPAAAQGIRFGSGAALLDHLDAGMPLEEWLQDPAKGDYSATLALDKETVLGMSQADVVARIAGVFDAVLPLVLLATEETPPRRFPAPGDEHRAPDTRPEYPLPAIAAATGLKVELLERWVRATERKGQAIVYGPPGTGKTYVARQLANYLAGGGDGLVQLVQFHPSYSYEDFIEGIRPQTREEDGSLYYDIRSGRFLEFCREAAEREGTCVLIIDEINRANLSRVLGELMYLLEYREEDIPLPSGQHFRIPQNVRLIGTMNTADRSIALVDHALRRRFAFLHLRPEFSVLRRHASPGFPVEQLIDVLQDLNKAIGNGDYEIGITYFLADELGANIEDIWQMEIEPYLEEYFFDKPEQVTRFRWDQVRGRLPL